MMDKIKAKFKEMIPNPLRLVTKLFCLLWFFLFLNIFMKITFNYWQPYVVPNEKLEYIGNYINEHRWLNLLLDGIFYTFNSVVAILCGIQQWKFKSKLQGIITLAVILTLFTLNETLYLDDYTIIVGCFILPLALNYKKWIWILLTFGFSFIFLFLSTWLEGFANADNTNYIIKIFLQTDYYIMLLINFVWFNMIRMKREMK